LLEKPFSAYQGDEPYVFVCYAHEDSQAVFREISWLREQGINIWYDEGISPGSEWPDELAKAIKGCRVFLYFLSPAASASEHCRREVSFALDQSRVALSLHLQPTNLPDGLNLSLGNRQAILSYQLHQHTHAGTGSGHVRMVNESASRADPVTDHGGSRGAGGVYRVGFDGHGPQHSAPVTSGNTGGNS